MTRALAVTLLLFAAILGVAAVRYAPPAARGPSAPSDTFSEARARGVLSALSGSGASRATGTDENARARALLEGELGRAGFSSEIQRATSCSRHGTCARVANVIATRPGREPGAGAVLLMAHYDSVPCGPGASDDGLGVAAVVEAARALGASPPLRRTVVIVLTDGEESGLLGANAFVQQHPLAKTVRGVVNVDARGTSGPSAMFETSAGNGWLVGKLAQTATRPVTSSLFYEIYRRMPNDTDFTSVKGLAHGVNFANIAGVERYHTPLDSLEHAGAGTLQHHGDQALAMVRALAESGDELDAPHDRARDAVWFDVLATFIVRWPVSASLGLALVALALVAGWSVRMRAWGIGLVAPLAALLGALAASTLAGVALELCGALPVPWVAHPLPAILLLHLACIGAGLAAASLVARRSSPVAAWAGTWLTWGALGVVTAAFAPGACFLFVVPTLAAGFAAWLRVDVATIIPAFVAAVLWMPLAVLVYDGLGFAVPAVTSIASMLLVTTVPALLSREPWPRRLEVGASAALAAAALAAVVVPVYSADKPQRVNVVFRQDDASEGEPPPARVYVEAAWAHMPWGSPPEPMLRALGPSSAVRREAPTPWSTPVPFAEAPRVALDAPRAVVLETTRSASGSHVRVRLVSPRGARTVALVLPEARRTAITVEGQTASPRNGALVLRAVPPEGIEVALDADGDAPIGVALLDVTPGVPSSSDAALARAVRDARPAEAAQTQEGDVTVVARRIRL
jgi:hypothetical protein